MTLLPSQNFAACSHAADPWCSLSFVRVDRRSDAILDVTLVPRQHKLDRMARWKRLPRKRLHAGKLGGASSSAAPSVAAQDRAKPRARDILDRAALVAAVKVFNAAPAFWSQTTTRSSCVMLRSSPKSDAGADEDSIRRNYDRDHYADSQNQLAVPPDEAPQIRQGLPQKWSRAARFKASRSRRLSGPCNATCAAAAASISACAHEIVASPPICKRLRRSDEICPS